MHRRKIQLIAGTTYSVSLPKDWVKKNNLKERSEIILSEKNNGTIVVSPTAITEKKLNDISLNLDEYTESIDQVLFAIYYLGIENITLFSKKELTKDVRARIRKTLTHMSGTEISYEDKQKIAIRVLLDKTKIDIAQVLYRISLIIDMSITELLENLDINEIRINENEIDRLYHLTAKIVSLALIDSNILSSSNIKNISLIPSYFLISKKLENIGDAINHLSDYLYKNKINFPNKKEIMEFIRADLNKNIKNILSDSSKIPEKTDPKKKAEVMKLVLSLKDQTVSDYLRDAVRYVMDINGEVVNISFYNKLIKDDLL